VLDSTGLQLFGRGEWNAEKHGRARRQWRKLLTDGNADVRDKDARFDGASKGVIASVTADGVYGSKPVPQAAAARQRDPSPNVTIPPRASAVPGTDEAEKQSPGDRHILLAAKLRRNGNRAIQASDRPEAVCSTDTGHEARRLSRSCCSIA
jgi:hypothetical protein